MSFLKQIFTWWHKQTLGTFIYTLFAGKFVGMDEFGNKYYSSSKGKRWVIYKNYVESSKIPAEWHSWIHFLKSNKPSSEIKKFTWQKKHKENQKIERHPKTVLRKTQKITEKSPKKYMR